MRNYSIYFCLSALVIFSIMACISSNENKTQVPDYQSSTFPIQPDWAKDAVLYELNVRQFSEAGNLQAVQAALPRLKKTGVDIIWLMPIFPIGEKERKGSLGSPYSVRDYKAVNPEYGTISDLKVLVQAAHKLDMKIILDWVPNHTSWDHVWLAEHTDFHTKYEGKYTVPLNEKGEPIDDWSDVMDLDYENPNMRLAMIDALQFWVRECAIDGYRFDMAGLVPNHFWVEARPYLDSLKHLFMLAEWQDEKEHFNSAFQFNYAWKFKDVTKEIAAGDKKAVALWDLKIELDSFYPAHYAQVLFTTNHDENTWNGNDAKLYGAAWEAMTVLTYTWGGIPMFYNGQESGLEQQLAFFEKDPVAWKDYKYTDFYAGLSEFRKANPALQNQPHGGETKQIKCSSDDILAFSRTKDTNTVVVLLNLSPKNQKVTFDIKDMSPIVRRVFEEKLKAVRKGEAFEVSFEPWGKQYFGL